MLYVKVFKHIHEVFLHYSEVLFPFHEFSEAIKKQTKQNQGWTMKDLVDNNLILESWWQILKLFSTITYIHKWSKQPDSQLPPPSMTIHIKENNRKHLLIRQSINKIYGICFSAPANVCRDWKKEKNNLHIIKKKKKIWQTKILKHFYYYKTIHLLFWNSFD